MAGATRFTFRFADAYRRPARLFGVTPQTAWLDVDGETLDARFGRLALGDAIADIGAVTVTGRTRS